MVQIQCSESRKLIMDSKHPVYFLAEVIPRFIYIKFYRWVQIRGMYVNWYYNSMIDENDGHIPSPLIMFTCTMLRHAHLEWQKNNGVHPKASRSKLKAFWPDRSYYLNNINDGGRIASCWTAVGRKLLALPGVQDMSTLLMNTLNTYPESYQQRV